MKSSLVKLLQEGWQHMAARPVATPTLPWSSRLRWTSRHWLGLMGWPGILAVGVLAICPAFYFSAIRPAQQRLEAAHRSAISLHQQQKQASKESSARERTPMEQMEAFYQEFPHERSSPLLLEKLVSVAESHGITLNEGEYKATQDKVGRLVRFQITLPLKGEYPQIRRFLAALLVELPVMSLESVQFERRKVADANVEAKVRLVLFMGRKS